MPHKIIILNPIEGFIQADLAPLIAPCLSYKAVAYIPGQYAKRRIENDKSTLIRVKNGFKFYAGLLSHILKYCKERDIEIIVEDKSKENIQMYEPYLPGITFREDQLELINNWLDKPRGIIVSPTGSGKTIIGLGCISSFENLMMLWLCHTKDLQKQAYNEARKLGFKSVGRIGDGFHETNNLLTIATRQSFRGIADTYSSLYDVVIVDETHHVNSFEGEYHYILSRIPAPFRLGLTASEIKEGLPELAATGLIGPIVGELTINDAINIGILATPKMKMLKTSVNHLVKNLHKYPEVYSAGIVHNEERNILIAQTAKFHADKDETVLIMVTQLDHGDNILAALKNISVKAILVEGLTKTENREKIKDALQNKHIHVVICSSIWKEGINIPSLNCVILACGGKDPLQALGRGLRKTSEKDILWFYDIFDPSHRYLIEHFGYRLCWYMEHSWI
jgi:superfamily II DNA or RNA helicase